MRVWSNREYRVMEVLEASDLAHLMKIRFKAPYTFDDFYCTYLVANDGMQYPQNLIHKKDLQVIKDAEIVEPILLGPKSS
jgi:hypothetical protein